MTETNTQQAIETHAVEVDSSRDELLAKYGVTLNTLKKWCSLTGIDYRNKITFSPDEVSKLDFAHHKLQVEKLTYSDFERLVNPDIPKPGVEQGYYASPQDEATQGSQVSSIIEKRYQGTIDAMAKPVARAFWESFDAAVLREVAAIASTEQVPTRIEQNVLPAFVEKDLEAWLLSPASEEVGC